MRSPDLNPIEQVFAKLEHVQRKAGARTVEAVCFGIGEVLQLFTPEDCARHLVNSGYLTVGLACIEVYFSSLSCSCQKRTVRSAVSTDNLV